MVMQINQQALGAALVELLPPYAQIIKGPSFYIDKREVYADVQGLADPQAVEHAYLHLTGHRLRLNVGKGAGSDSAPLVAQPGTHPPMEINAAYATIREALEPFGLYKTSLKQGQIVLAFISPQVGQRHQAAIASLAQETGYCTFGSSAPRSECHHPGRDAAGSTVRLGCPQNTGLHVDRAEIFFTLASLPNEQQLAEVTQGVEARQGYRLVIKV